MSVLTTYAINGGASVIAADSETFNGGVSNKLFLVGNDFTPDASLTLADLTFLSGDGLSEKTGVAGAPGLTWDSAMGVWGISVSFTGGTSFICVVPADPVKTAFGWALVNDDVGELLATGKFDEPIVFDHIGVTAHVPETQCWFAAPYLGDLPTISD